MENTTDTLEQIKLTGHWKFMDSIYENMRNEKDQESGPLKGFSGVIESVRGVIENGEMWIEFKLDHHKPYFRVSMKQYTQITKLLFVGHLTNIAAYRGHRHWKLVSIGDDFSFCISTIGGPSARQLRKES